MTIGTTATPERAVGRRIRAPLVAAAVALLVAAGCGTDPPSRGEVADALVTSGLERPVAECVADAVTSSLTDAQLVQLVERGAGGAPRDDPADDDDAADRLRAAMAGCRDLAAPAAAEAGGS